MDHETPIDKGETDSVEMNDGATLIRWAGAAAVAAAVLIVITQVGDLLTLNAGDDGAPVVLNAVLKLVAACLLLLGLVGLFARQAEATGTLGLAGFLVAFLGTVLLAGDMWLEAFAVPYLTQEWPEAVAEQPTGTLLAGALASFALFATGWGLFGVATLRARLAPRGAATLLIVGGVVGFAFLIVPGAGLPLAAAVGWCGWWLYQSPRSARS